MNFLTLHATIADNRRNECLKQKLTGGYGAQRNSCPVQRFVGLIDAHLP